MPLKWKSKTLLAKIETVYGTDPVPTGAANAILAIDVSLSPMEGEDVSRNLERPWMGASPMIPVGVHVKLSFKTELVASGTLGTAPAWGPLARICGAAQVVTPGVKVEYAPITDNIESGAIYMQIDTARHVILGARGTCKIVTGANGIPVMQWDLTGLFTVPADQAVPTPVYTGWQAPQVASKLNTPTFTIGALPFVLRNFEFDLGNDVQPRLLIGSESILLVDRSESLAATVEATTFAIYNPFTVAQNQTLAAIQLVHGTVAAKRVKLDFPSCQLMRLTGYEEQNKIVEWPLKFVPLPVAGNDQWKITLE